MPQKADLFRVYGQETSVVFRRVVQLGEFYVDKGV